MPVVTITLIEGDEEETRRTLERRLTDAVRTTAAAPLDGITVIVHEVAAVGYRRGRQARTPGTPLPSPAETVPAYLEAVEGRDFAAAGALLAEGFTMLFPGGGALRTPEELAAWAKDRYRSVGKTFERFDEVPTEDGVVVYGFGRLAGEWIDGGAFSSIRFIDRFTVADGRLVDQRAWNDMGQVRDRS